MTAIDFFQNQVDVRVFLKDIVQTNDVIVPQFRQDANFFLQTSLVKILHFALGNDFDGIALIGLFVVTHFDDGKGALAQFHIQFVQVGKGLATRGVFDLNECG